MFKKLVVLTSFILILGLFGTNVTFGDIIEIPIAVESDDAEQNAEGGVSLDSSDLEFVYDNDTSNPAELQVVGLRFVDVQIPKGSIVASAAVRFDADDVDDAEHVGQANIIIDGELTPNPGTFEDTPENISARPRTSAQVQWSSVHWAEKHEKYLTSDITGIIQEIISQEGWEAGNALVLVFSQDPANPSTGVVEAESFKDNETGNIERRPTLIINLVSEIDIPITNGGGDAEQHLDDGDMDIGSSDLELAYEDAGEPATDEQVVALRFLEIPIDNGAPVARAYVEVEVDKVDKLGSEAPVNLIIEGELVPDAAAFEDVAYNITDRAVTTAKVQWSIPAWTETSAKFQTPDISSILQELVNQEGWISGNAIVLIFRDDKDNPSTGLREAESIEGESEAAPTLHIAAQFTVIEVASVPNPADGTECAAVGTSLSWMPNSNAVSHDVYFGAASPPELVVNQDANSYYPGQIEPETTYYWQVDEILEDGTVITGDMWTFTTGLGNIAIDKPITAGNDDGEDHIAYGDEADDGSETRGSSDLEMPWEDDVQSGSYQVVGLRFKDLSIPKGATVLKASVQFTADNEKLSGGPVNFIINGLLQPDTDGLGSGENFSEREPKTIAEVSWTDVPEWTSRQATAESMTPDISSIIQEIINQDDWAPGNALMLFVRDDETNPSAGIRSALAGDGGVTVAPRLHIEAISEAAVNPAPADGAIDIGESVVLNWLHGFSAVSSDVYFGTDTLEMLDTTTGVSVVVEGLVPSTTYSWRIDETDAADNKTTGAAWSFTTIIGEATEPNPADLAVDVPVDVILSWKAGATAVSYDVYFGTADSLEFMGNQAELTFTPSGLGYGAVYSWRVDAIDADAKIYAGTPWSFTTPSGQASNPDPADESIFAATSGVFSWIAGPSAVMHDGYVGTDPNVLEYQGSLAETMIMIGVPGGPIPDGLVPGMTYYWRIDEVEVDPSVVHAGEVWSFTVTPLSANNPIPADGAELASDAVVVLSWTAGLNAKLHSVYFGDDLETVTNAVGAPPKPVTTFDPGQLEAGKTYYWRVDEFNPPNTVTGDVWSFSLAAP